MSCQEFWFDLAMAVFWRTCSGHKGRAGVVQVACKQPTGGDPGKGFHFFGSGSAVARDNVRLVCFA